MEWSLYKRKHLLNRHHIETDMECYLSDLEELCEDLEAHLRLLVQHSLIDQQRLGDKAYEADLIDKMFTEDPIESPT